MDPHHLLGLSSLLDCAVIRAVLHLLRGTTGFTITLTTSVMAVDFAPILC